MDYLHQFSAIRLPSWSARPMNGGGGEKMRPQSDVSKFKFR